MVAAVSIVVTGKDIRPALDDLIESFDRQSLPTDAFEVLFADLGSTDETLDRLRVMTGHRPNLFLLEAAPVPEQETPDVSVPVDYLGRCSGDYVLKLRPDQLLYPEALERLHDYAVKHDLDAVAGRVVQPGSAVSDVLQADAPALDPESSAVALASPVVLIRRSLATAAADLATSALPHLPKVGVLASTPTLRQPATQGDARPVLTLTPDAPAVEWNDDQLMITVTGRATGASAVDLSGARPLGLLRHVSDHSTYLVGQGEILSPREDEAEPGLDWAWQLKLVVDVRTAGAGKALRPGVWEVDVQLTGTEAVASPVTVGWAACRSAVIGRVIVVPSPVQTPTWQLDVGPAVWPLVADPTPAAASVIESAAGSLLVLALPDVHVSGTEEIEGEIALERLPLAAKVITDGVSARLESFVSGLAGAPRLATRFGTVPMKQTGLALNIAGDGKMEVVAHVPPQPQPAVAPPKSALAPTAAPAQKVAAAPAQKVAAAPAKKAAAPAATVAAPATKPPAKKAPAKKVPASNAPAKKAPSNKKAPAKPLTPVQKIRRGLPSSWEPLVKRVAKSEAARHLYRRIAKL